MEPHNLVTTRRLHHLVFRSKMWRILATGFAFSVFGLIGLVYSLTLFPLLVIAPVPTEKRRIWARSLIGVTFRLYLKMLNFLGLISYQVSNKEALYNPGQLIIANHPSLLDVVFLMAMVPANCVVKSSLWRNPFTAMAVRAADYIPNDDPAIYERCLSVLGCGESLIIFPEGTRSTPGQPLKFHRGPAHIAMGAKPLIRPVLIECEPATLIKNQAWYQVPDSPPHFAFRVMPLLKTDLELGDDLPSSVARRINKHWQTYFYENLRRN